MDNKLLVISLTVILGIFMVSGDIWANPEKIKKMLERNDANQDGKVTREEFRGPGRIFKRLDTNGDGVISEEEQAKFTQNKKDKKRGNKHKKKRYDPIKYEQGLAEEEARLKDLYDKYKRKIAKNGYINERHTAYYLSSLDQTIQPYIVHVPEDYTPNKKYALAIKMAGYGPKRNFINFRSTYNSGANEVAPAMEPTIGLYPCGRGGSAYFGLSENDILTVIQLVKDTYSIDEDRVFLSGHSHGGHITWQLGVHYPDMWAAIAVKAGPHDFHYARKHNKSPGQSTKRYPCELWAYTAAMHAKNLINLPVVHAQGINDNTMPAKFAWEMNQAMKDGGVKYHYIETEKEKRPHLPIAGNAEATAEYYREYFKHKRNLYPKEVYYKTFSPRFHKSYWVDIEQMQANKWAEINAVIINNTIDVKVKNIIRFKITVNEKLLSIRESIKIKINNKVVYNKNIEGNVISFKNINNKWSQIHTTIPKKEKHHNLAGPIEDIFQSPFLLVNGEKENDAFEGPKKWGRDELLFMIRRDDGYPKLGVHHKMPMLNVENLNSKISKEKNLILAGDYNTHSYIEKIADMLPIKLNKKGFIVKDKTYPYNQYTLLMIAPNPLNYKKYVLILTSPITPYDGVHKDVSYPYLPDYIVYDRKADEFIDFGFFNHKWELE